MTMDRHDLKRSEREGLTDAEADELASQIDRLGCRVCRRRIMTSGYGIKCSLNQRFPRCRNDEPGFLLDDTV